jgi:pimeloyl-ACP methyl ester carboxylesterase
MASIWYLHGAGASPISFTWLKQQLREHQSKFLSYQLDESTHSCVDRLSNAIAVESEPVVLIGHSMGGIIGRICADHSKVSHLITLCAPFGGIQGMHFLTMFNNTPMYHELSTYSGLLGTMRATTIRTPHLAIVASHGMPYPSEPNDGVVTLASQTALPNQNYFKFELNHFEVLLSPQVAMTMNTFLAA